MMGAVSSKIPCERDGQNSIGQALPETSACKIMCMMEKVPRDLHSKASVA